MTLQVFSLGLATTNRPFSLLAYIQARCNRQKSIGLYFFLCIKLPKGSQLTQYTHLRICIFMHTKLWHQKRLSSSDNGQKSIWLGSSIILIPIGFGHYTWAWLQGPRGGGGFTFWGIISRDSQPFSASISRWQKTWGPLQLIILWKSPLFDLSFIFFEGFNARSMSMTFQGFCLSNFWRCWNPPPLDHNTLKVCLTKPPGVAVVLFLEWLTGF